ncbi:head GIN domain-containing protein [Winogradskyella sp. HB-48]|uniref:head GIN domain-containing protein n=1 Tax=Winogradskyella sp. HB-48 TaxID=3416808 RepID=UPI003CF7A9D4
MKNYFLLLAFIAGLSVNAQGTIEKSIGEFSTVKVYDLINLKMIKSDENKVIIAGDNKEDVQVINNNGKLKIRMKLEESYDGNDTVVKLYYTSVDVIDANEGANVVVNEPIEQFEIDLKTQEGGEITAQLKSTYANFRAVTGGIINVSGSSKNQDVTIYTGGIVNGEDLKTEQSEVSVNAGGEAYIYASDYVEVRLKAGGNVYIYGNPKEIHQNKVLGGTVKRM